MLNIVLYPFPFLLFHRVTWGLGTVGSAETEMQNHVKNKNKTKQKIILKDVYVQQFKFFRLLSCSLYRECEM